MWKQIKLYAMLVLVLVPTGAAVYFYYFGTPRGGIRVLASPPALVQQIQQLSELVSVKYRVQKVIVLQEQKVPFGSEKLALLVQAEVLAGVDLSQLKPEDVAVAADKSVRVTLPAPAILHRYVDEKQTKVWSREKSWWTPWVPYSPDLDQKARLLALESVEATAREMGILDEARRNAETAITGLLAATGISTIHFTFK